MSEQVKQQQPLSDEQRVKAVWDEAYQTPNGLVWRCATPVSNDHLEMLDMEHGPLGVSWSDAASRLPAPANEAKPKMLMDYVAEDPEGFAQAEEELDADENTFDCGVQACIDVLEGAFYDVQPQIREMSRLLGTCPPSPSAKPQPDARSEIK